QTFENPVEKMTIVAEKMPFILNFHFLWGDLRSQIQRLNLQNNLNTPFVDAIFHDAFSPRKIPELWSQDLFNEYIKLLNPGGVLTTYSVSKPVRQGLHNAGFKLFDTQKLGTKKGGTLAVSCLETLTQDPSLIPVDIESLLRECVEPYRDRSLCLSTPEIHQNRNAKMLQKRTP
ncbi:MAG: hypothetical protein K2X66_02015, partial [Cyanobacteria bacterium]|nr:hypothetical protein [Cyanobacteriota bacterium]